MNEIKIPIPSRIYNSAQGGHVCGAEDVDYGSKVVHLVPEKTFEEQVDVNEGGVANTIYVIHDDFTLAADVTIPENCTLQFDGGSLNGSSTITFSNTQLKGTPKILCDYDGGLSNDVIDISWFGTKENDSTFDNGNIIENVLNTFKRGSLYGDAYYFSSPITISNYENCNHEIKFYCKLIYNGQDNNTAITLNNIHNCNIRLDYLTLGANNSNCTGIKIAYAKQNIFDTGYIHGFKNGVILQPGSGLGNVSNIYNFREICSKGDCTHLTLDASNGWVNDNTFNNTYFGRVGDNDNNIKGLHLKGAVNANRFYNLSFEWNTKCVIIENAVENVLENIRCENCSNIVTSIGVPMENQVKLIYISNSNTPLISSEDNDEATTCWGVLTIFRGGYVEKYLPVCGNIKENVLKVSTYDADANIDIVRLKGYWFDNFNSADFNSLSSTIRCTVTDDGIQLPYNGYVALVVDTHKTKFFNVIRQFTAATAKVYIRYLEKNGTPLNTNFGENIPLTAGFYYYNSEVDAFVIAESSSVVSSIRIPDEITRVEFAIREFGTLQVFDVLGIDGVAYKITGDINMLDNRADVVSPPIGQMLFENGRPIYWNGTAWVDATGNPV